MSLDFFDVTRATVKYVLNANGVLEEVPANVPAFEFNPDGSYKGCLIEPAATNLIPFGQAQQADESESGWVQSSDTLTKGFDKYLGLDVARHQRASVSSASGITRSAFFAISGSTQGRRFSYRVVLRRNSGISDYRLVIRETGGAEADQTVFEQGFTITDDFAVYSVSGTVNQNDRTGVACWINANTTGDADLVAGLHYFVEQEQDALGSWHEGTRNADVITKTDAADLIGTGEITMFASFVPRKTGEISTIVNLNQSGLSNNNRYTILILDDELLVDPRVNGESSSVEFDVLNFGEVNKIAITYKDGKESVYHNGSELQKDRETPFPNNLSVIDVGNTSGNGPRFWLNDHIRSVALWKRALTEAEAIALTTL